MKTLKLSKNSLFGCFFLNILFIFNLNAQTNYYYGGSGNLSDVNNWYINTDATGANPANFTTANQIFVIQNGQSPVADALLTISGANSRLTIASGGTFSQNGFNHNLTLNMDANARFIQNASYTALTFGTIHIASNFEVRTPANFRPTLNYPNLILNFTGTLNGGGNNITVNGNLTIQNNAQFTGTTSASPTHTINGDLLVEAGGTLRFSGSGTGMPIFNLGGDLINNGSIVVGSGTNTINFVGPNSSLVTWGTKPGNNQNVNIISGKVVTFNDGLALGAANTLIVDGTLILGSQIISGAGAFTLAANGSLEIGSSDGISTTGLTGNIQTSTRNFPADANYTYNGMVAQSSGSGLPSTVNNLTLNNTFGLTLNNSVNVNGTLDLQNGNLNTGSNQLSIGSSDLITGNLIHTSGVIIGNLRRWFAAATNSGDASSLFPLGDVSGKNRFVRVSFTSAPTVGGFLDLNLNSNPMGLSGIPINNVNDVAGCPIFNLENTLNNYWEITNLSGTLTDGVYTMSISAEGIGGVSDICELRLLKRIGAGNWLADGTGGSSSGSTTFPTVTAIGLTGWSNFGFGSGPGSSLNITSLDFIAEKLEAKALLSWECEISGNHSFEVESSQDGLTNWNSIATISAKQNSSNDYAPPGKVSYDFIDMQPLNGENYYRLAVKMDHKTEYSAIRMLSFNSNTSYALYPNPSNGFVSVQVPNDKVLSIQLIDLSGRVVSNLTANTSGTIDFSFLSAGCYITKLSDGFTQTTQRLIISK